ncbi:MAG: SAM-dependent methyltransferase, partial [Chloroflexota bacterium]|nr:SAM-dependent methyltransferase [Chloroflexota bacterium]
MTLLESSPSTRPVSPPQTLDEAKLNAFVGKAVGDWGTLTSSALVVIGDKLGLYQAMSAAGPVTSSELAGRTGTVETYVRPWLVNQAAGGYIEYDAGTGTYSLPPEHAAALGQVAAAYYLFTAMIKAEPRIVKAFTTGEGMLWGDHDPGVFFGCERFFRPGCEQNLVQNWIPALEGVQAKLERGAEVADVGCGHGASTIIMATA